MNMNQGTGSQPKNIIALPVVPQSSYDECISDKFGRFGVIVVTLKNVSKTGCGRTSYEAVVANLPFALRLLKSRTTSEEREDLLIQKTITAVLLFVDVDSRPLKIYMPTLLRPNSGVHRLSVKNNGRFRY